MSSSTPQTSYLIIGAGVFGTSAAFHLLKAHPGASVTLLDRHPAPSPESASWDWNKVVRADYTDNFYIRLALDAIAEWRSNPLFKPFYHESGLLWLNNSDLTHRVVDNYKKLDADVKVSVANVEDAKEIYQGLYAEADYSVRAMAQEALKNEAKYVEGEVGALLFDGQACQGVRLKDGTTLHAAKTIPCTGAAIAKLLVDSAPERVELHVGDRICAAAVASGLITLTEEKKEKVKHAPVFVNQTGSCLGETMPPMPDGLLKFTRDVSFKNTVGETPSGEKFSMPPDKAEYDQYTVPEALKKEIAQVQQLVYGKLAEEFKTEKYRICWDGITPNQDFIISPHPHAPKLYIATAGSFHGWKFMPIIGQYIVRMLHGTLDADVAKRWSWDRDQTGGAHGALIPRRELHDLARL